MIELNAESFEDVNLKLVESYGNKSPIRVLFKNRSKVFTGIPADLLTKYYVHVCFVGTKDQLKIHLDSLPKEDFGFTKNTELAYLALENCEKYFLNPYADRISDFIKTSFREGMKTHSTPEFSMFFVRNNIPHGCLTLLKQPFEGELMQSIGWAWIDADLPKAEKLAVRRCMVQEIYDKTETKIAMGIYANNWRPIHRVQEAGFRTPWLTLFPF